MSYIQHSSVEAVFRDDDVEAFKSLDFYSHPDSLYFTGNPECEFLSKAIQAKALNIAAYLLGHLQCPIKSKDVVVAVLNDDLEMVKLLAERGAPVDETAFQVAAQKNSVQLLSFMTEKGINPCFKNGLALSSAAARGAIEAAQFLIEQGCSPNINGNFPISVASKMGQDSMVNYLLTFDQVLQSPDILSKLQPRHKNLYLRKTLTGPTMALQGLNIDQGGDQVKMPIHIVEQILNHAYSVENSYGLVDTINRIQNIFDIKK